MYFSSVPKIVVVCTFLEFYNLRIAIMVISFKSPCHTVQANFFVKTSTFKILLCHF